MSTPACSRIGWKLQDSEYEITKKQKAIQECQVVWFHRNLFITGGIGYLDIMIVGRKREMKWQDDMLSYGRVRGTRWQVIWIEQLQ